MNLKQLFGICEHKWDIFSKIPVYTVNRYGEQLGTLAEKYEYVLKCKKCGDIKKKSI